MCVGPQSARAHQVGPMRLNKVTLEQSTNVRGHSSNDVLASPSSVKCSSSKKKVRFVDNTSSNKTPDVVISPFFSRASDMSVRDKANIWWDEEQLRSMKESAQSASLEMQQNQNASNSLDLFSYGRVMMRTYKTSFCRVAAPYTFYQHLSFKEQITLYYLEHWVKKCDDIRGLERWSIPGMGRERAKHKFRCIQNVLEIQRRIKMKRDIPDEMKLQLLRQVSRELSVPAQNFAFFMGKADAAAASFSLFLDREEVQDDTSNTEQVYRPSFDHKRHQKCTINTVSKKDNLQERMVTAQLQHKVIKSVL